MIVHLLSHSVLMSRVIKFFIRLRVPPLSIDVSSDLGLLHVVDALPLTHPGLVRGPCSPSPQASRAWRASHHVKNRYVSILDDLASENRRKRDTQALGHGREGRV